MVRQVQNNAQLRACFLLLLKAPKPLNKMMKHIYIFTLSILVASSAFAQDEERTEKWLTGGAVGINASQTSLTNWSAGGDNAISGIATVNLFADMKDGKHSWVSDLYGGYGLLKSGDNPVRKSDDRLQINSKYGYDIGKKWYATGLMNFWTQFADGYQYVDNVQQANPVSALMAPGYLQFGVGFDWLPNENFSVYLSPATGKFTFVANQDIADLGTYGNDAADTLAGGVPIPGTGSNVRTEVGAHIRAGYKRSLNDNLLFNTTLGLFSNYLENPDKVDVNWNMGITAKVWEFLAVTLSTELIYDYDILLTDFDNEITPDVYGTKRGVQFRQILGVGLTYTFGAEPKK
jgi:hypothetical protein